MKIFFVILDYLHVFGDGWWMGFPARRPAVTPYLFI